MHIYVINVTKENLIIRREVNIMKISKKGWIWIRVIALIIALTCVVELGMSGSILKVSANEQEKKIANKERDVREVKEICVNDSELGEKEVTVYYEDGSKDVALTSSNNIKTIYYDKNENIIRDEVISIDLSNNDNFQENNQENNNEKNIYEKYTPYVKYNVDKNGFELDTNAYSELTNDEIEFVKNEVDSTNKYIKENNLNEDDFQDEITRGKKKKNMPTLEWYGVHWKMSNKQITTLVKVFNAGAGIAACTAALAEMGVITAIGAPAAGLVSAALWAGGAILDLYNDLAGNNGLTIRVTWNGILTVLPK